jgi:hypothetical protein
MSQARAGASRVLVGEGFVGAGAGAAHVNTVLGDRHGPVGAAWVTALATPRAGHRGDPRPGADRGAAAAGHRGDRDGRADPRAGVLPVAALRDRVGLAGPLAGLGDAEAGFAAVAADALADEVLANTPARRPAPTSPPSCAPADRAGGDAASLVVWRTRAAR